MMDAITAAALSVQHPALTAFGLLLDNPFIFSGALLAALLIGERRNDKRKKILAALVLAVLSAAAIKWALAVERPCALEDWCPDDFSFPSLHASAAFALMTGFLTKKWFPLYLLLALMTAFTRMNLGVHVFDDIAAALPIAIVSYYIIDLGDRHGKGD